MSLQVVHHCGQTVERDMALPLVISIYEFKQVWAILNQNASKPYEAPDMKYRWIFLFAKFARPFFLFFDLWLDLMNKLTDASLLASHPTPHADNTIRILNGAICAESAVSGVIVQSQTLCSEKKTNDIRLYHNDVMMSIEYELINTDFYLFEIKSVHEWTLSCTTWLSLVRHF